ncbi:MAG: GDP-mannose 4,6-dehydratase [Chloroflexi bacterium]|nr:GDP-mannose 4,6-dehydratase [Chloroflexota bacterium]
MTGLVLVTGATGFIGSYAVAAFQDAGREVVGTSFCGDVERGLVALDLRNAGQVESAVARIRPSVVVHLAAMANPGAAQADPARAYDVNVLGQLRLIQALLRHAPEARLVAMSSAEIYGRIETGELVDEEAPLRPASVYAATKAAADLQALQYHLSDGLDVLRLRLFGGVGPGRSADYFPGRQVHAVAAILDGRAEPVVPTFSLAGARDYVDVRDVAQAIVAAAERGRTGAVYNVATGRAWPLRQIVERLIAIGGIHAEIHEERQLPPGRQGAVVAGDATRLRTDTGWQPRITMDQSLRDALAHARQTAVAEA